MKKHSKSDIPNMRKLYILNITSSFLGILNMTESPSLFGNEEIDKLITRPIISGFIEIIVVFIIHGFFGKFAYKASPFVFNSLASYFGLGYLYLTASLQLICFNLFTITLFVFLFYLTRILNSKIKYNIHYIPKFCIVVYVCFCFRVFEAKDDFDESILTLIVLSVKLLCVTENEKTLQSVNFFTLVAYFLYCPWISYASFINLRRKNNKKTAEWWLRVCLSVPQALLFKLLSNEIIQFDGIFEFSIRPIVFSILKGFQYRNMYYFRAQIAEIELLAAGVQEYNWKEHLIFDFDEVEFSVLIKTAICKFNKPLTGFVNDRLKNKNINIVLGQIAFLVIIYCYSVSYFALFGLFLGSLYLQECAIANLERFADICLYSCPTSFCYHVFGKRYICFYYFKAIFIVHNQFRMSLLFVNSEAVYSSFICIVFLMAVDVGIIIFCRKNFKEPFHFFKYMKQDENVLTDNT